MLRDVLVFGKFVGVWLCWQDNNSNRFEIRFRRRRHRLTSEKLRAYKIARISVFVVFSYYKGKFCACAFPFSSFSPVIKEKIARYMDGARNLFTVSIPYVTHN